MGHKILIGVSVQTRQTIGFRVAHLPAVDGIAHMDGKKPPHALDTRKVEIASTVLLAVL